MTLFLNNNASGCENLAIGTPKGNTNVQFIDKKDIRSLSLKMSSVNKNDDKSEEHIRSIINKSNHNLYNPENERIIKKFKDHQRSALRKDEKTLYSLHKSIRCFEILTDFQNLSDFNPDTAKEFMQKIRDVELSVSYLVKICSDVQKFIRWLANEPFGRKVKYNDADYLNLSQNELNAAKSSAFKPSYTYKTLINVVNNMPSNTEIEKRNKALFSIQVLCSLRANELRNLLINSIVFDPLTKVYFLNIDPKKIKGVKFNKARQVTFLNIPTLQKNVLDWRDYLIQNYGFGNLDPLFPSTANIFVKGSLKPVTIFQKSAISLETERKIFNDAFVSAGEQPLRIHSIRHTRARYIENITHDEKIVALQQDFGHSSISTTRNNYGNITPERQRELISQIDIIV